MYEHYWGSCAIDAVCNAVIMDEDVFSGNGIHYVDGNTIKSDV